MKSVSDARAAFTGLLAVSNVYVSQDGWVSPHRP